MQGFGSSKKGPNFLANLENHSCMSVKSPEKLQKYDAKQDKNMANIL